MAEIVNSLFGVDPASIRQARDTALQERALQYAKLDPFQRATAGLYSGASRLGDTLGGMLGGVDPQLQKSSALKQLASQFDTTSPQGLQEYARALASSGYNQEALQVANAAQGMQLQTAKLGSEQALAAQRLREKAGADPIQQLLRSGKFSTANVAAYERTGNIADLGEPIEKLSPPEIKKLQDYRDTLPVGSTARQEVDAVIKAEGRGKGTTITNQLPGVKGAGDLVGLRKDINLTVKPYRDAVNSADQAISLANDVLETQNFASSASLARQLAKAAGETQLSKADVAAFGGDPSFVGSVSDIASRLASGVPTADTTRQLKALAVLLKKKNEALEQNEIKQLQNTARLSGLYTDDQIKNVFTLRGATQGTTRRTPSGVSYTVEESN